MGKKDKQTSENSDHVQFEDFYCRVRVKNRSRNVYFNTGEDLNYDTFILRGTNKIIHCI